MPLPASTYEACQKWAIRASLLSLKRVAMEISGHRPRAIFDRYNIVSGRDLDDAMAKRAAYEAEMSKASRKANSGKEPVAFPSPHPSPRR